MNNEMEFLAGTNPTNSSSVFCVLSPARAGTNVTIAWKSVPNSSYTLQYSTNLAGSPAFLTLASNLAAKATGTNTYTHTNAASFPRLFYRVYLQ